MLPPLAIDGALGTWNGPSTVLGRRSARPAMIDRVDQHAHAEHVRGEDEFLPLLRAQLAGAGEPIDRDRPFRLRRLDVAHEAVEMLDQGLHDLAQARIGNVLPALQRDVGQVVFGYVGHGHLLESAHCCCCCLSPITSGHDRRGGQLLQGGKCQALRVFAQPDITGPGCGDAPGTVSHLVFPTDYFAFS